MMYQVNLCENESWIVPLQETITQITCVWALVPVYEQGDSTIVMYDSHEQKTVEKPVKYLLSNMAKEQGKVVNLITGPYGEKRTFMDPITIDSNHTFAKLKCRKPIGKDSAYGYFNAAITSNFRVLPITTYSCTISFNGGIEATIFHSASVVEKKMRIARQHHISYMHNSLRRMLHPGNVDVVSDLVRRIQLWRL